MKITNENSRLPSKKAGKSCKRKIWFSLTALARIMHAIANSIRVILTNFWIYFSIIRWLGLIDHLMFDKIRIQVLKILITRSTMPQLMNLRRKVILRFKTSNRFRYLGGAQKYTSFSRASRKTIFILLELRVNRRHERMKTKSGKWKSHKILFFIDGDCLLHGCKTWRVDKRGTFSSKTDCNPTAERRKF